MGVGVRNEIEKKWFRSRFNLISTPQPKTMIIRIKHCFKLLGLIRAFDVINKANI